jgi:hypothetical protein
MSNNFSGFCYRITLEIFKEKRTAQERKYFPPINTLWVNRLYGIFSLEIQ